MSVSRKASLAASGVMPLGARSRTTAPWRRSMMKNGAPRTAGSSQTANGSGASGKCGWTARRMRYSRAISCALGATGPSGGRRRTYSRPPARSRYVRFEWPLGNCSSARPCSAPGRRPRRNSRRRSSAISSPARMAMVSGIIRADQPLGGERRLGLVFDFDGDAPGDLHAALDVADGVRRDMRADARAGGHRGGEAQPVEAVIDAQARRDFELDGFMDHPAEQGNREEAVGDGGVERRFAARPLGVGVDPLVVAGEIGEAADHLLRDDEPRADAGLAADRFANLFSLHSGRRGRLRRGGAYRLRWCARRSKARWPARWRAPG